MLPYINKVYVIPSWSATAFSHWSRTGEQRRNGGRNIFTYAQLSITTFKKLISLFSVSTRQILHRQMCKCLEKGIKARELFEMIYRRLLISFVVDTVRVWVTCRTSWAFQEGSRLTVINNCASQRPYNSARLTVVALAGREPTQPEARE